MTKCWGRPLAGIIIDLRLPPPPAPLTLFPENDKVLGPAAPAAAPLGSGLRVPEPTGGSIIIYVQTGTKTEPSGTHELYARKSGFRGADGARLEMSSAHSGRIFEVFPSSYKGNLRRQENRFLYFVVFALRRAAAGGPAGRP